MPILDTEHPDVQSLQGLHLYHAGVSNCSMRVRLLLDEKGVEWTSHPVSLGKRENLQDWYLAINPKGLVPALVHDGVPVTESNDIMVYIEETFPEPSFTPADPGEAAQMRASVDMASQLHMKAVKTYVYGSMGATSKTRGDMERYARIQPDKELVTFHQKSLDGFSKEEVQAAADMLHDIFRRMEARLADHAFLVGDRMSLADIAWVPQYVLLAKIGFDFSPYPNIAAWNARLAERPAYKTAILDWTPNVPMPPKWILRPMLKAARLLRL